MALPNISFTKGSGGLSRSLPNEDNISGIIFYDATKPSGFSSGKSYVERILNIVEAEALGITNTYSDETKASATITITATGTTTATLNISLTDYSGTVDFGTYTCSGGATTVEAAAISAFINAQTYSHNYTSTVSGSTITVTAPSGKGVALNTISFTLTWTGQLLGTSTAFTGGVASKLSQYHYQISEYYRLQPNGILYVMFSDVPTTYFSTEILTLQTIAEGKLRQVAIFANAKTSIALADVTSINNAVLATEAIFGVSLSVLYSTDIMAATNLNTMLDLSSLTANKVSCIISQSFSGDGLELYNTTKKSIPTLGACLGTVSLSKVSESIAWVGQYNISDGTECETIGFANGQLYSAISNAVLEQLNGFRYIYLRKFIGQTGTFWNDSNCAINTASDYAYLENNRTIDKAIRVVKTALTPYLNSPLVLNADGTLNAVTIAAFRGAGNFVLQNMKSNTELSDFLIEISNTQNVLSTSTINITIKLLPVGVARFINISIGFAVKL